MNPLRSAAARLALVVFVAGAVVAITGSTQPLARNVFPYGAAQVTLGTTTVGRSKDAAPSGEIDVSGGFQLSSAATIVDGRGYLDGGRRWGSRPGTLREVVYPANGAKPAASPIAVSDQVAVAAGSSASWRTFRFHGESLPAGTYWIGFWIGGWTTSGNDGHLFYTKVGNPQSLFSDPGHTYSSTGSPGAATWPSSADERLSAYLDLTTAPSPPPPPPPPPASVAFPLSLSSDGRHLVDRNGAPFLLDGDAAWSLIVGPDSAGADLYLSNRAAKGFNAVLVNLIEHYFDTNGAPKNANGDAPFLTPDDFSTPNTAYFSYAASVIGDAYSKGIEVVLFPAYLGSGGGSQGWYQDVIANGTTKMLAYGRYVGNLLKGYPNIIWAMGGDDAPGAAMSGIQAMVQGIQQTYPNPVFTAENGRFTSGVTQYPGQSWLGLNTTYSDCTNAPRQLQADYDRSGPIPFFFVEGKYENEGASAVCLRSQAYWSVLEGAAGAVFGNNPIWDFYAGWQAALDSSGANDMARFRALFLSRSWAGLVPDEAHAVLTSGYGDVNSGSYAAAARTANGHTVVVYTPDQRGLTLDLTKISGTTAKAWWYNPSTGAATLVGSYATSGSRTFTPPAAGDWVLVVDDASLGLGPPGS